jgi:amino acid adenylation domain-containing protein
MQDSQLGEVSELLPALQNEPEDYTILDRFARWARTRSSARAFTFLRSDGGERETLTFDQLWQRSMSLAHCLTGFLMAQERAILAFDSEQEFIEAFLACLVAGVIAVPASLPRYRQGADRLAAIAGHANARAVLTGADTCELLRQRLVAAGSSPDLRIVATSSLQHSPVRDLTRAQPGDVAMIQYTSGSTGAPKGILLRHTNLIKNQAYIQAAFGHSSSTIFAGVLPLFHDMGLIGNVLQPLYLGISCVLIPPAAFLKRPACWLEAISRYRVTTSGGPNFVFDLCVDRISKDELEEIDLSCWAVAFNGAEHVSAATLDRFSDRFRESGFRKTSFFPCYGLAEATLFVAGGPPQNLPVVRTVDRTALQANQIKEAKGPGTRLVSCGMPQPKGSIRIVDPETAQPLGPAAIGEIWVRSESIAAGYWNNTSATEETFAARLSTEPGVFLRTGDLGFLDSSGALFVTGRCKDLIIIHGENIYPHDVEGIVSAVDPRLGRSVAFQTDLEPVQTVVLIEPALSRKWEFQDAGAAESIFKKIRAAIYQAQGIAVDAVGLIASGSLPRTTSGKLRRSAAASAWQAGTLDVISCDRQRHAMEDADTVVAAVLAGALGIAPEALAGLLPLVTCGIDSLRAASLANLLEKNGISCLPAVLLAANTLEEIKAACSPLQDETPPAPAEAEDDMPLGEWQKPFWFAQTARPTSASNNVRLAISVCGDFDALIWSKAVNAVLHCHEACRVTISLSEAGEPRQRISIAPVAATLVIDAASWNEAQIEHRVRAAVNRLFDLAQGPLFFSEVLHTGKCHVLVFVAHHIAVDLWSMAAIFEQTVRQYNLLRAGSPEAGREQPRRFRDFLARNAAALERTRSADLSYWRNVLCPGYEALELPLDRLPLRHASESGSRLLFEIDSTDLARLRGLCALSGATLHMALLSIYRILLYRYTGQNDILIGTPLARRSAADEDLVGCLINPVPVRCCLDGTSTFNEVLADMRQSMLAALRHGNLPFHDMVREAGATRASHAHALYQTIFALQKVTLGTEAAPLIVGSPDRPLTIDGLALAGFPLRHIEVPFDVALMMAEGADRLWGSFEYRNAVLNKSTVEQFARHLQRLLRHATERPDLPICSLPMLDTDDLALLEGLQCGDCNLAPNSPCTHCMFEDQAARTPDAVAIRWLQQDVTYRQLQGKMREAAVALRSSGIGQEDRIGVGMQPSADWVAAILAVWHAGATLVPLEIGTPPDRLRDIVHETALKAVICDEPAPAALRDAAGGLLRLWSSFGLDVEQPSVHNGNHSNPQSLAYIAFTSGSGGKPKGVMITHAGLSNFVVAQAALLERAALARVLQITPASFDAAFSDVFMTLVSGGTLCIAPQEARLPGRELRQFIRTERITLITATPSFLTILEPADCPDLVAVISMGEVCTAESARRWARFCAFYNGYGPTEASIGTTLGRFETGALTRAGAPGIGEPFAHYVLYILDRDLNHLPPGAAGGLFVGGPGIARGYVNHPDWTAEHFLPDPYGPAGSRMYKTGDRGRWHQGRSLEFLGRSDRQVKLRGVRIEPSEIEMVLRTHPTVRDCYLDIAADECGEKCLVAYVVGSGERQNAEHANFLRQRFPFYMMPARFIYLDKIPARPNGKVDREKLPRPEMAHAEAVATGELQRGLCRAWNDVLSFAISSIDENFFDLGGHSLLLHRLQTAVEKHTGFSVSLLEFFDHPTIRSLASHLAGAGPEMRNQLPKDRIASPSTCRPQIAIIGMAGRFPGAPDIESFWRNIITGQESITFFSAEELAAAGVDANDPAFVAARGIIEGMEYFDAAFFGFSQREAEILDPQKRLLLELAQKCLDDAGYAPSDLPMQNHVGVFVGTSRNSYYSHNLAMHQHLLQSLGQLEVGVASDNGFTATLIAYKLNLSGPCLTVDTACSTSLVAVHQACQSLWTGECRMAIAGGASIDVPVHGGHHFEEGLIASPDGHCRAFDAKAKGTVKGMGGGLVALKMLDAALEDGDHIYAVIRGSAMNNDGARKIGFTAPSIEGQELVLRQALESAQVSPHTLGYVEAHGTGTALGDVVEIAALNRAFHGAPAESIAIGSVKSNIGHLDAASGIAGLIKCALVVSRGLIPPQVHLQEPNPRIDWAAGPFYVPAAMREWRHSGQPRRAGVSSFGIGGANAHVVLEEAPVALPRGESVKHHHLVNLSAGSAESLRTMAGELANVLRDGSQRIEDVAYTLATGRRQLAWRMSLVCDSVDTLMEQLLAGRWMPIMADSIRPKVLLVFPGEGAAIDSDGLSRLRSIPAFAAALDECYALLDRSLAARLTQLFHIGEHKSSAGEASLVYPATFAIEYACWSFLRAAGIRPDALIGHGAGELAALCVAGSISLADGLGMAAEWGCLAEKCPAGAMLAVAASAASLGPILQPSVAIASITGPNDCMVSGQADAISRQEDVLRRVSPLPMRLTADRAFHSDLMAPVGAQLSAAAEHIAWCKPLIPVCSAATGDWIDQPKARHWTKVVAGEQQFANALARAAGTGPLVIIEAGPAPLLLNALRRNPLIDPSKTYSIVCRSGSVDAYAHALETLGRLWENGLSVDLKAVVAPARRISLPGVSFNRTHLWLDPVAPAIAPALREEPLAKVDEKPILQLWKTLLGVSAVVPADDFFSLGGDSLLAIEFAAQLGTNLGTKLRPQIIFEYPTFGALSAYVASLPIPAGPAAQQSAGQTEPSQRMSLSREQQALLLAANIEHAAASLNLSVALSFAGPIDPEALQSALRAVAARHPVLLHNFDLRDETGSQWRAHEPAELALLVKDADTAEWDGLLQQQANMPFSVSSDLLIRATLLVSDPQKSQLIVTLHHVVADGRSLLVLLHDLAALYGNPSAELPHPGSYAEYIAGQTTAAGGNQPTVARAQPRDLAAIELPANRPGQAHAEEAGHSTSLMLNAALTQRLRRVCREQNLTLFVCLLAAFEIFIRRFIEGDDVVIASPMMSRNGAEHSQTVGPFVGLAVFRNSIRADEPFSQVASRVRDDVAAALDGSAMAEDCSFDNRGFEGGSRTESAFRIAFALNHAAPAAIRFGPATTAQPLLPQRQRSRHRAMLWIDEIGDGLRCTLEYRTAWYDEKLISRYLKSFERVLEAVTCNPAELAGDIDLLSDEERKTIAEWNDTACARPAWNFVQHKISAVATSQPHAPALICEGSIVDYRTLDMEARRIARLLQQSGTAVEEPVGIILDRGIEFVIAALGILYAGACYVPLDPELPPVRIQQMVQSSGLHRIIRGQALPIMEGVETINFARHPEPSEAEVELPVGLDPRNLAYILFTSGSTGVPKGVMVEHRALANRLDWMIEKFGFSRADTIMHKTPISFDVSVWEILAPLSVGATLVIAKPGGHRDMDYLSRTIIRQNVTIIHFVPSLLQVFLDRATAVPSLRLMICSGEVLRNEVYERACMLLGDRRKVANFYGPTEAAIDVTAWTNEEGHEGVAVCIGRPIQNIRIHILDRRLQPVPIGVTGELYIAGVGLARGYTGAPHLTAERFLPDPFGSGGVLYRTGDRVRWKEDGGIEYCGRSDLQLKLRGMRIEPDEIESVLRANALVENVVVTVAGAAEHQRLVAYVVPTRVGRPLHGLPEAEAGTGNDHQEKARSARNGNPQSGPAADAGSGDVQEVLLAYVEERLPRYMVPQEIILVDSIPVTHSGKLDRAALESARPATEVDLRRTPPSSPAEVELAGIWKEVLGGNQPDRESNFFHCGGNSLLAARLVAAIEKQLGRAIGIQQLFDCPTLGQLAGALEDAPPAEPDFSMIAQPAERFEPFPMTAIQQAYMLGRSAAFQLGNVSTQGYLEIEARGIDRQRFVATLNSLIQRHDMLRAVLFGETMLRVLAETRHYEPAFIDLSSCAAKEAESVMEGIRSEMSEAVFDLTNWPLFEVRLSRLAADLHVVHIALDALIVDGASAVLLEREFNRIYLDQRENPASGPGLAYRDYAVARWRQLSGDAYRKARAYWVRRLEALPAAPRLPLRVPIGTIRAPHFKRMHALLDAENWQALKKRAQSHGITGASTLVAAYAEVLAKWSGEDYFLINLPINNRAAGPEVQEIIGNFTSTLLLEADLRGAGNFEEIAGRINGRLWLDLAHREFDGVELQRVWARQHRTFAEARTPIVFTGLLDMPYWESGRPKPFDLGHDVAGVSRTSQVLLDCVAVERRAGLLVNWDHLAEAFPPGMIAAMFDAYVNRLRSLALSDDSWGTSLPAALPDWRAPQVEITARGFESRTLLHPVLDAIGRFPDRVAVVSRDVVLTFAELRSLVGATRARLTAAGMRKGDIVAIHAEKGWEQVVAALGILLAGGAYVPVEVNLPPERRHQILKDSGARFVVAQPALAGSIAEAGLATLTIARDDADDATMAEQVTPHDLAYVIFTSGSTGRPKGVAMEHGAAANTVLDMNQRFSVTADDAILCVSALGFDLSVYDMFGLLAAGGKLVFPDHDRAFDADHWWQLIVRHGITLWNTTPLLAAHLLEPAEDGRPIPASHPRLFLLSGDWIPLELPDRIRRIAPAAEVVSLGGATEAAIWSIFYPVGAIQNEWKSIPYGRPLSAQDVVVLDRNLDHCPSWVTGDIYIGGLGLARGYWGEPELTAKAFIQHAGWQTRLYRTGDLGRYLPDGNIEFLGRRDSQVKLHGVRLELGEVESAIESRNGIERGIVLADRQGGRDVQRLVAYVSLAEDAVKAGVAREIQLDRSACEQTWQAVLSAQNSAACDEPIAPETSLASLVQHLEDQYCSAIVELFAGFPRFEVPGSRVTLDEVLYGHGIAPRYRHWLARAFSYLAGAGYVKRLSSDVYELLSNFKRLRDEQKAAPDIALDKLLREEIHSAELYADDSTAASYQMFYRTCHRIAAAVMAALAAAAGARALRVLEVGAGYGSLTEHVLPVLRAHDAYAFTDISNFFLSRAGERFEQYKFVSFDYFDIEIDPQSQGHERHSYDAIIAASVLHNAADIAQTLARLKAALAPGGMLLLIEETRFFPFFDLGMGLQQGFGDFDDPLRPGHPLLSRAAWGRALADAGFIRSAVLNRANTIEDQIGFDVILAQGPESVRLLNVSEMERHLEQFLLSSAVPKAWIQVDTFPRSPNGKIDRQRLNLPRDKHSSQRQSHAAPRNQTESMLADIWSNVMGLSQVGITDDFFSIGGDSLVASRVVAELRKRTGLQIQLRTMFQATTIEALAALVDNASQERVPEGFIAGEL